MEGFPMNKILIPIVLLAAAVAFGDAPQTSLAEREIAPGKRISADGKTVWWDAKKFLKLEGQAWNDVRRAYDRLPQAIEKQLGAENPGLVSKVFHTSGECFRFTTTARNFKFRWSLVSPNLALGHMPATGVSGIDMYVFKQDAGIWIQRAVGVPKSQDGNIVNGFCFPGVPILVYLPLYNGVKTLEIGVGPDDEIKPFDKPRSSGIEKPVVFYGTSITQGGVASRPGMSFAAIVTRWLDVPLVNLGFSGSGKMEMVMCDYLSEIDASCYVLDCVWNMNPQMIKDRFLPFVRELKKRRPNVPIVLAEDSQVHIPGGRSSKGEMVKAIFDNLKSEDSVLWENLYLVPNAMQYCADHEGTVDGAHPNDWGMMHLARGFTPVVAQALKIKWDGAPSSWK